MTPKQDDKQGIILSEEFRKYQLRRGFVSDQRSCKICGMEETPPGQGTDSWRLWACTRLPDVQACS